MAVLTLLRIQEKDEDLQALLKRSSPINKPRIKLLLLMQQGLVSTQTLAAKLKVSDTCIGKWKKRYQREGLEGLLKERRGSNRKGAITAAIHQQIKERLCDPKAGFTSYKQAQAWINATFGLSMKYHAVNKYLKYHFHTRLKVGRKTHVQKDPLLEQAFKKGVAGYTATPQSNPASSALQKGQSLWYG